MTRESVSEKGGDSMDYGKLKTYYESIDGVTVPFVYPQYWDKDKEEWVVVDKDNRLPVDARLTGSNMEEGIPVNTLINSEIETVLDAVSVEGNEKTASIFLNPKNASELYLFISIDQKPWTIRYRNQFGLVKHENGFPVYFKEDKTYSITAPAISFPVGYDGTRQGVEPPSNIKEAKDWSIPITDSEYFWVENNSDELATITVRLLRVWR